MMLPLPLHPCFIILIIYIFTSTVFLPSQIKIVFDSLKTQCSRIYFQHRKDENQNFGLQLGCIKLKCGE